jgi:hypothetical protein
MLFNSIFNAWQHHHHHAKHASVLTLCINLINDDGEQICLQPQREKCKKS